MLSSVKKMITPGGIPGKEAVMKKQFILMPVIVFVLAAAVFLNAQPVAGVKITILYDNYISTEGTTADWGFSCLIKGTQKTILFDTGTKPDILFHNIKKLNVNAREAEAIVISHNHLDHHGGLWAVLETNHRRDVYIPHSFPENFMRKTKNSKANPVAVDQPLQVCRDVYLSGEMGDSIKEQSLIMDTEKGLVIVTGCSHPGVVSILKKAMEIHKKKVFMILGGFHLLQKTDAEIKGIIGQFKKLGVQKVGATHCSGDRAIKGFKEAYGKDFVVLGVGKVIKL
jgi:7,8-dihydropterin-6-yl-methyl-4-(beta-D-ribofuranosyl)aminobenzene 5'-phosphate synthase